MIFNVIFIFLKKFNEVFKFLYVTTNSQEPLTSNRSDLGKIEIPK